MEIEQHKFGEGLENSVERKPLIFAIMENIIYFIIFFPMLSIFIYNYNPGILHLLKGLVLLADVILATTIRLKEKDNFKYYSLLAVVSIFVVLLGSGIYERMLYLLFSLVVMFCSRANRKKIKVKFFTTLIIFLGIIFLYLSLLAAIGMQFKPVENLCLCFMFLLVVLVEIYLHSIKAYALIKFEGTAGNKIMGFNFMFVIWTVVVLAIIGLVSVKIYYSCGANNFDIHIVNLIKGKAAAPQKYSDGNTILDNMQKSNNNNIGQVMASGNQGIWLKVYSAIVFVLFCILFLITMIFFIILISGLIIRIYKKLTHAPYEESHSLLSKEMIKKSIKNSVEVKFNKFFNSRNSLENEVRKYYYKIVEKMISKKAVQIEASYTPKEIEETLELQMNNITKIYEEIRYGNKKADKEDIDIIKSFYEKVK